VDVLSTELSEIDITRTYEIDDVFEKYNPILYGPVHKDILKSELLAKYLAIAKCIKPQLSKETSALIVKEYAILHSQEAVSPDATRTLVTPRTVESIIHLLKAHAKARLSKFVERIDVTSVVELINISYFQKINK